MEIKLFEILDRATFIPAMAVRLRNRTPEEFFLLRRAGYGAEQIGGPEEDFEPYILLCKLDGNRIEYDPHAWGDRIYRTAHLYIIDHWAELMSGDVIDVEFILGETVVKKVSEARI